MAWAGDRFYIASADPAVVYGAHVYSQGDGGSWNAQSPLRLIAEDPARPEEFNMAGLMAIMQPAQRSVAAHGDLLAAAIVATQPRGMIRIMSTASGRLVEEAVIDPDNVPNGAQIGLRMALTDGHLAFTVGNQNSSAVHIYSRGGDGSWSHSGTIEAGDIAGSFGSSLAFVGNRLAVAATARNDFSGSVVFYEMAGDSWNEVDRVVSSETGDAFASSFSVNGSEMWVGAPNADSLRGRVDRFLRSGGDWSYAGPVGTGNAPGDRFGTSVALSNDVAAVGAPFAQTRGRVAVFTRSGGDWQTAGWLATDPDPTTIAGDQVRCESGEAAGFGCEGVDIESFLTIDDLGGQPGESVTDLWGWTDSQTGREYAIVGRTLGPTIVDITDANNPRVLGSIAANPAGLRDMKVYQDHLFFVGDGAGDHGMHVFDLSRVRDAGDEYNNWESDAPLHRHRQRSQSGSGYRQRLRYSGWCERRR